MKKMLMTGALIAALALGGCASQPGVPPERESLADVVWDPEYADLSGYDPCADLSWIIVPIDGGTASSPYQVALFHQGRFVQAATEKSYGFFPRVRRMTGDTIEVVFVWPRPDEPNAAPTGETPMTFHWDADASENLVAGDPPDYL